MTGRSGGVSNPTVCVFPRFREKRKVTRIPGGPDPTLLGLRGITTLNVGGFQNIQAFVIRVPLSQTKAVTLSCRIWVQGWQDLPAWRSESQEEAIGRWMGTIQRWVYTEHQSSPQTGVQSVRLAQLVVAESLKTRAVVSKLVAV